MLNEHRIIGPPGTGKTTYLARQISLASERYGADKVMVTSFTKAAAVELVSRDVPVAPGMVGTLHSHCYRALGQPVIAEEKLLGEWNQSYGDVWPMGQSSNSALDESAADAMGGASEGDKLLAETNRLRARLLDIDQWPQRNKQFAATWEEFKRAHSAVDYTDLIDHAYRDITYAPGYPDVLFVDEAQDLTPLQVALVRQWAGNCERLLLVGDDDQTLYTFAGASPEVLMEPELPADHTRVLSQSWRVPRAVHQYAQWWVEQLGSRRIAKRYEPRDEDGQVVAQPAGDVEARPLMSLATPGTIVDSACEQVHAGRSVMILASCSYMLDPLLQLMRREGIPFGNRYRRKRGDWNPLAPRKGVSAAERVLALLMPHQTMQEHGREWTFEDLCRWIDWMETASIWKRGAKRDAEKRDASEQVTEEWLEHWLLEPVLSGLWSAMEEDSPRALLHWWHTRLLTPKRKTAEYVAKIAERWGPLSLVDEAPITVGTIHSVKGGQADVVYVLPDLSVAGQREWETDGPARDAIVRMYYVAATRAREALVLCNPSGGYAVDLVSGLR